MSRIKKIIGLICGIGLLSVLTVGIVSAEAVPDELIECDFSMTTNNEDYNVLFTIDESERVYDDFYMSVDDVNIGAPTSLNPREYLVNYRTIDSNSSHTYYIIGYIQQTRDNPGVVCESSGTFRVKEYNSNAIECQYILTWNSDNYNVRVDIDENERGYYFEMTDNIEWEALDANSYMVYFTEADAGNKHPFYMQAFSNHEKYNWMCERYGSFRVKYS